MKRYIIIYKYDCPISKEFDVTLTNSLRWGDDDDDDGFRFLSAEEVGQLMGGN